MPIKATASEIKQFSDDIKNKHDEIQGMIVKINEMADRLTARWLGAARQAYDPVMDAYFQKAKIMNDQLLQAADKVAETGRQFESADIDFRNQFVNSSIDI